MRTSTLLLALVAIMLLSHCKKEKAGVPFLSDKNIYALTQKINQRNYYDNGATLSPLGNSPHGSFRLWVNNKAASVLNMEDELPIGGVFPDSSLLVKEIQAGGSLSLYAIMYKLNSTWYWAEYKPDGEVFIGIGEGGAQCISCHSTSGNRDFTRTYELH